MEKFERKFDTSVLKQHVSGNPGGVVDRLFARWALPGEKGGCDPLRVAVRKGYLNLYVGGQSVARMDASAHGLSVTLHRKYFEGWIKGSEAARKCGQERIELSNSDLHELRNATRVDSWISTASSYSGDEKRFVNDLTASNPAVVDIEMALPGDDRLRNENGKKSAPRMDLVTVVLGAGPPCINFWEAKCASNSELRARAEIDVEAKTGASVVRQLRKYVQWLALDGRAEEVSKAFQQTGKVLCELAAIFGKETTHPAVKAWTALAQEAPRLVHQPGIVIANYTPSLIPGEKDRQSQKSASFDQHRLRLGSQALTLIEVSASDDQSAVLPALPAGHTA